MPDTCTRLPALLMMAGRLLLNGGALQPQLIGWDNRLVSHELLRELRQMPAAISQPC